MVNGKDVARTVQEFEEEHGKQATYTLLRALMDTFVGELLDVVEPPKKQCSE